MIRLDIRAFGLMLGFIWSASVFVIGIISMTSQWGAKIVKLFATIYIGYGTTILGSLIGAFWGFIDGAITGVLIAWVYNRFVS